MLKSNLDSIKGIGPKTKEILLKNFESVSDIKNAGREILKDLIGPKKTSIIKKFFET